MTNRKTRKRSRRKQKGGMSASNVGYAIVGAGATYLLANILLGMNKGERELDYDTKGVSDAPLVSGLGIYDEPLSGGKRRKSKRKSRKRKSRKRKSRKRKSRKGGAASADTDQWIDALRVNDNVKEEVREEVKVIKGKIEKIQEDIDQKERRRRSRTEQLRTRNYDRWLELGEEIRELTRQRGSFNAKIAALLRDEQQRRFGGRRQDAHWDEYARVAPLATPPMTVPLVVPDISWGESPISTAPHTPPRSPPSRELAHELSFGSVTSADIRPDPDIDLGYGGDSIDPGLFHPEMTSPQEMDPPPELARALALG
jgi:hypothetical protein